jgi:hypothetical protein
MVEDQTRVVYVLYPNSATITRTVRSQGPLMINSANWYSGSWKSSAHPILTTLDISLIANLDRYQVPGYSDVSILYPSPRAQNPKVNTSYRRSRWTVYVTIESFMLNTP